jgi:2-amino-4-hydroxy-6-hydroxymethyldihydropteridine diphosphokinase
MPRKTAYLGLGSNLGDREANLRRAIELLADADLEVRKQSSLWETAPRDMLDQPWFLNQVIEVETRLFAPVLLGRCMRVEKDMGRTRRVAKGPRTIDIDILLYGTIPLTAPGLEIPHPRLHERRFVLEPLAEIAPELRHPVLKKTMTELLAKVKDQDVRRHQA